MTDDKSAGWQDVRRQLSDWSKPALIALVYGSPRMVRELRGRNIPASKPRVERLMREHGIRARHKRRYKATTDSKHKLPIAATVEISLRPAG